MLGTQFLDIVGKLQLVEYAGMEDLADKLSFMYSVGVLLLCTSIIAVKQYLLSAIACYIATTPSGSAFDSYLENFCWVHGTIPVLGHEKMPQGEFEWEKLEQNRINYYQWVPFMLGLQCMLFYLPRLFWQTFCYNRSGSDLEHLITLSSQASRASPNQRSDILEHVIKNMETMFYYHRDFGVGKIAAAKRVAVRICGPLFRSKRQGTWLVFTYFAVKTMYLANAFGQLYLMQRFLDFNATYSNFGYELAQNMMTGKYWRETRIFPRISYCRVPKVRHLGVTNDYIAQCVLPVNMLNEKVYIFLWFWTAIVALCTVISIPMWFFRVSFGRPRLHFVRKFLLLNENYHSHEKTLLKDFTFDYLRYDGLFLLRMISLNAGEVVTAEIVTELWKTFKKKYANPDHSEIEYADEIKKPKAMV